MFKSTKKFVLLFVLVLIGGCDSGGSNISSGDSSERTYVKNRFKAEGYSNSDSEKAANAVMKFHEAQKNRK